MGVLVSCSAAKELAENSHVQDAFVIAVEQQAKERLERLSALRKIKPVDMTKLSQQLCDSPPGSTSDDTNGGGGGTIYSAPVAHLGSTSDLHSQPSPRSPSRSSNGQAKSSNPSLTSTQCPGQASSKQKREIQGESVGGGYVTDEEIELRQTIQPPAENGRLPMANGQRMEADGGFNPSVGLVPNSLVGSSKEVLIGGDNNPSRRSSRSSVQELSKSEPPYKGSKRPTQASECHEETVQEGDESQEYANSHSTLTQTASLKSVVGKWDQYGISITSLLRWC